MQSALLFTPGVRFRGARSLVTWANGHGSGHERFSRNRSVAFNNKKSAIPGRREGTRSTRRLAAKRGGTMKYFTPDLYVRGQSLDDDVLDEVDRLWEEAGERYAAYLDTVRAEFSAGLC